MNLLAELLDSLTWHNTIEHHGWNTPVTPQDCMYC